MVGCLSVFCNWPRAVWVQDWYLMSPEAQGVRVLAPAGLICPLMVQSCSFRNCLTRLLYPKWKFLPKFLQSVGLLGFFGLFHFVLEQSENFYQQPFSRTAFMILLKTKPGTKGLKTDFIQHYCRTGGDLSICRAGLNSNPCRRDWAF